MTRNKYLSIVLFNFYKKNGYIKKIKKLKFKKSIKIGFIDICYNKKQGHGYLMKQIIEILKNFYNFEIYYIDFEKEGRKNFTKSFKILEDLEVDIIINMISSSKEEKLILNDKIIYLTALDNYDPCLFNFPANIDGIFVIGSNSNNAYKNLNFLTEEIKGNSISCIVSILFFIILINELIEENKKINFINIKNKIKNNKLFF